MKFDVIIPCGSCDVSFVPRVVEYIKKFLVEAENIYIITNKSNFSKIQKHGSINLIDENSMLNYLNLDIVKKMLAKKKWYVRQGWYFQQFLKLGFALSPYSKEYYLSWDADTLPLRELKYFDEEEHPLFTKKSEYHPAYFETNEKLVGIGKVQSFSFIAEHMLFKVEYVKELLATIESSRISGDNWVEKCIEACEFSQIDVFKEPYFSEFELYGSFVMEKHQEAYRARDLRTFRNGGMIRGRKISDDLLKLLSFDLDIASFEYGAPAPFPYNLEQLFKPKATRFDKYFNMPFLEIPSALFRVLKKRL